MKEYNIEFGHIYADRKVSGEQFKSIGILKEAIIKIVEGFDSATTVSPLEINPCGILDVDENNKCFFDETQDHRQILFQKMPSVKRRD